MITPRIAISFATILPVSLVGAQTYTAIDLGTLGGSGSAAFALNNSDLVVGASDNAAGQIHAFAWENGQMTDLGVLPGDISSRAVGVNNLGQVVGTSTGPGDVAHAVRWDRDGQGGWTIVALGALPGGVGSRANRINDDGEVIGQSSRSGGVGWHAFVKRGDNAMVDLGVLHYPQTYGFSEASGINNLGVIVGFAYAPTWGPEHGFWYDPDHPPAVDITASGQFELAHPMAINNNNVAAGWISGRVTSGEFLPAIYTSPQGWTPIGLLPDHTDGYGYDINDDGQLVGVSFNPQTQDFRGFLYDGSTMQDINVLVGPGSPGFITEARGVNSFGSIAANADGPSGPRAVLLTLDTGCPADFDGDGFVTGQDFDAYVGAFEAGDQSADFNGDGFVTGQDFDDFVIAFEAGC